MMISAVLCAYHRFTSAYSEVIKRNQMLLTDSAQLKADIAKLKEDNTYLLHFAKVRASRVACDPSCLSRM